jgi:hypothetical protein
MMKFVLGSVVALAALVTLGPASAETRSIAVRDIGALSVSGPIKVVIAQGPQASAVLEGSATDLARFSVRFRTGELDVWRKCRAFCGRYDPDVTLRVTAPALRDIEVSKGAEASATGLDVSVLEVEVSTGATLRLAGRCTTLDAVAAMGASLDASDLACANASVEAAMGAVAKVNAREHVDAGATMGGEVKVSGGARVDGSAFMGGIID